MPHVVSASRRTDIPAFFAEWFMNRVNEGFCLVPNPYNSRQISHVLLDPDEVDAIVFWTKDPAPMLGHIATLEEKGFHFYFQFTLNRYPKPLEPNLPPLEERVSAFKKLAEMIGPERVVWRYDPIIISNITDYRFHRSAFKELSAILADLTKRVVISVIDFYKKTERHLKALENEGLTFVRDAGAQQDMEDLLSDLAKIAHKSSLEIVTCAEKHDYSDLGIPPGKCIDGELIESLWNLHRTWRKDPNQREECGCIVSKDIGAFDSCPHSCPYCYATRDSRLARARYEQHDPYSTALLDNPQPTYREPKETQGFLF